MSQNYFSTCATVEEVKKLYRTLAMRHHPDRGGDLATMQSINAQYHATLERLDGATSRGSDNKDHTYHYNADIEQAVMDKITETLAANILTNGVELWLIGTWLWVQGDTKPVKDQLKQLGYRWHSKRTSWYFTAEERRHFYNKNVDFSGLAAQYGAKGFKNKEREALAA